jgi:DNA-binding NarL/FixJ family response regulator
MLNLTADQIRVKLAPREWETAKLFAKGYKNNEVAKMLTRSPKTICTLRCRIKNKLCIEDSIQWMDFLKLVAEYKA